MGSPQGILGLNNLKPQQNIDMFFFSDEENFKSIMIGKWAPNYIG